MWKVLKHNSEERKGPMETFRERKNTGAHIKDVFTSRSSRRMSENEQGTVLITTLFIESCERRQYNEPKQFGED